MTRIKNYFTLLLLFSSYMLSAQTAESIIEKYMENTGGREAWSKITSMKSTGSVKAQGLDFPTVMLSKGNKQKLTFTTPQKRVDNGWNQFSTGDDYSRRLFTSNKKLP